MSAVLLVSIGRLGWVTHSHSRGACSVCCSGVHGVPTGWLLSHLSYDHACFLFSSESPYVVYGLSSFSWENKTSIRVFAIFLLLRWGRVDPKGCSLYQHLNVISPRLLGRMPPSYTGTQAVSLSLNREPLTLCGLWGLDQSCDLLQMWKSFTPVVPNSSRLNLLKLDIVSRSVLLSLK